MVGKEVLTKSIGSAEKYLFTQGCCMEVNHVQFVSVEKSFMVGSPCWVGFMITIIIT